MKNQNFYMLAKTMYGLEEVLANELKDLGAQNIKFKTEQSALKEILDLCIKPILILEHAYEYLNL